VRYRYYDLQKCKMIAVPCGRQLLPGTVGHLLRVSFWPDCDSRESTQRPHSQLSAFGDADMGRLNERQV